MAPKFLCISKNTLDLVTLSLWFKFFSLVILVPPQICCSEDNLAMHCTMLFPLSYVCSFLYLSAQKVSIAWNASSNVTGFAKRGRIHASNFVTLRMCNSASSCLTYNLEIWYLTFSIIVVIR